MRRVLKNNSEVAHVWAQQKQDTGEASHLFFEGPSIYSYGRHFEIARFVTPDVVLFNSRSYSVSTSRHQGISRSAVSHKETFTVPSMTDHTKNVQHLISEINEEASKFSRCRSGVTYRIEKIHEMIKELSEYSEIFKESIAPELTRAVSAMWANVGHYPTGLEVEKARIREKNYDASCTESRRRRQEREGIARRARAIEDEKHLAEWKAGASYYLNSIDPVCLRVKDDAVETTRGASVPLSFCRRFWDKFTRGENVDGLTMGHYSIGGIDGEIMTAGCHRIPLAEIRRIAIELGW